MIRRKTSSTLNSTDTLNAMHRSLAIIEFDPKGKILSANSNFCDVMGYGASEIVGRNHNIFVDPAYAQSAEYRAFWERLGLGEFDSREYKRIGKNGKEVWIQASYNPIRNLAGRVIGVVKVATDMTEAKLRNAEFEAKMNAVSRVQAVIEFTPDGKIITANEAFLTTLGYRLEEIQGRQHSLFVEADYAASADYKTFWSKLNAGEFVAAEFKRIGKGGKAVWINASYNPIFDLNGRVVKVVKFATDVSERVRAVEAIGAGLEQLANNNLTHTIDHAFEAQFETLRSNFNAAVGQLCGAIAQVVDGATSIDSGINEIASASDDLSRRTEQQAASLEQTAAALDEITATVSRSAQGAKQAAAAATGAQSDAARSGEVVQEAITAMGEIEQSSKKITDIIGVIDEIAFQTNLLALNAGVEAARAGDAGRGFAVVAQEVRALAQRSADAAREITALITSSTQQVGRGVKLVDETGSALSKIVGRITEIDTLISEIAQSSQEQAIGLQQVNTAVNQMDQVTQQNAAMVEEATAATASLRMEMTRLVDAAGCFQIGGARSGPRSAHNEPIAAARAANPVRRSQGRIASAFRGATAVAIKSTDGWEEF